MQGSSNQYIKLQSFLNLLCRANFLYRLDLGRTSVRNNVHDCRRYTSIHVSILDHHHDYATVTVKTVGFVTHMGY